VLSPAYCGHTARRIVRASNALTNGFQDGKNLRIHGALEHKQASGEPMLLEHQTYFRGMEADGDAH
jgi:hypothetical protein